MARVMAGSRPWRALLVVLAASGLALGGATAVAAPGQPAASHALGASQAAPRAAAAAASCNPKASSLAPSSPPQVTPGSFMANIRARGYLIAGVPTTRFTPDDQGAQGHIEHGLRQLGQ